MLPPIPITNVYLVHNKNYIHIPTLHIGYIQNYKKKSLIIVWYTLI